MTGPHVNPFSDEEIAALREVIPQLGIIKQEAKFLEARSIIFAYWRKTAIAVAAFITAGVVMFDKLKEFVQWLAMK